MIELRQKVQKPEYDKSKCFVNIRPDEDEGMKVMGRSYIEADKRILVADLGELEHEEKFWTGPEGRHASEVYMTPGGTHGALLVWDSGLGASGWAVSDDAIHYCVEHAAKGHYERVVTVFFMNNDGLPAHEPSSLEDLQELQEIRQEGDAAEVASAPAPAE